MTATGWRLIGKAAALLRDSRQDELSAGAEQDVLFAAALQARPKLGRERTVPVILTALSQAIQRAWPDAARLTADQPLERPSSRFHGLRWNPESEGGTWRAELLWRHPHPVISGAPCTTHVLIVEAPGHARIYVRVTADDGLASVRGTVGAGQARPAFLTDLHRALRLGFGIGPIVRTLTALDIDGFVRDLLLSETRDTPIAVLSPLEVGGYVVSPIELEEELVGLAHVAIIDQHPATFLLTDALGDRRLSCYWGALRVYMPHFSCADRPDEHPLLVAERLADPVDRAHLIGLLGSYAATQVPFPVWHAGPDSSVENESPATAVADTKSHEPGASMTTDTPTGEPALATSEVKAEPATPTEAQSQDRLLALLGPMPLVLSGLEGEIKFLVAALRELAGTNAALRDEVERLRTTTAVRAATTTALERRLSRLTHLLELRLGSGGSSPASIAERLTDAADMEDAVERLTVADVLRQAATTYEDALLVLESAERAAKDSPYEDAERVGAVLDAMATIARRRQAGTLGTPLKVAFREFGIDYRGGISATTSGRHRQQYVALLPNGNSVDCHEHIVLGTDYDPRYCLRIYFTSRAPLEPRFVIGHVGRHLDVRMTT